MIVVNGLIVNKEGRVLITKRHEHVPRPNMWEYPGGKVEEGETERYALTRELKEELGVETRVEKLISVAKLSFQNNPQDSLILLYHCKILEGQPEPKPLESQYLDWAILDEAIRRLPMTPSTYCWNREVKHFIDSGGYK